MHRASSEAVMMCIRAFFAEANVIGLSSGQCTPGCLNFRSSRIASVPPPRSCGPVCVATALSLLAQGRSWWLLLIIQAVFNLLNEWSELPRVPVDRNFPVPIARLRSAAEVNRAWAQCHGESHPAIQHDGHQSGADQATEAPQSPRRPSDHR